MAHGRELGDPIGVGRIREQLISDLDETSLHLPRRPRPVTLVPGVDEDLAALYRAEAERLLTTMSAFRHEHPILAWLRQVASALESRLRIAFS